MLVFDDSCVGNVTFCVVHHGVALIVRRVDCFLLEAHRAVFQMAEAETVELVDASGEHDFLCHGVPAVAVGEVVGAGDDLRTAEQSVR